jgi:deazaflavin-dependent oxidoreductase (nitroreductase family)
MIPIVFVLALLSTGILLIRFRKKWLARFNLFVTNRITIHLASRVPGFGILTHQGRKWGRQYRTPLNVFRVPEGYLIALTYGRESEWVRNVLAAGGCQLETRRRTYQLASPAIVRDPSRQRFPRLVRPILFATGTDEFMQLSMSESAQRRPIPQAA